MTKTKIIATIGPVSRSAPILIALKEAGMSVARLNGSHSTLEWHAETIALLRETLPDTPVLLDIPGRKIRTLQLKHEPSFIKGDIIILTTDTTHNGEQKVPVSYDKLHERLTAGDNIFADDGTLSFQIVKIEGHDIHLLAEMDGKLKSRKGINVPGIDLGQALITEKDRSMIAFAKAHNVDYVGISFVESARHVEAIRELIGGDTPKIVAKVENSGGLEHLEEVIAAADVIMIDRGDLAVETSIDHVSLYQKHILRIATLAGKPTIVATELLHSMIENPLPTKAEISDITNAVLDGAAAVMLSGETAVGRYPLEAVSRIASVARLTESYLDNKGAEPLHAEINDIRAAIRALTHSLPVTRVIVFSRTGYSVRIAAMSNIGVPIVALGNDAAAVRSWNILPGVSGLQLANIDLTQPDTERLALKALAANGLIDGDDFLLLVSAQNDNQHINGNILRTLSARAFLKQPTALNQNVAEKVA
ncbi:Pyruvate kinase [Serratia plymuthica]|nr:Pyruvate kinase [Serratia plymuthica]VEI17620.1 Pyruvate kinase [Serratia plymuthica]